MKRNVICLMVFALLCVGTPSRADFIAGTEDVPQMQSLMNVDDLSFSFDTPEGRIVEVYQQTTIASQQQIETFYRNALPALGWAPTQTNTYERDGETLALFFDKKDKILFVRFVLTTQ